MPLALTINDSTTYLPEDEQTDAIRRYWEARQRGDTSAKLVRIDSMPEPDPEPTPPGGVSSLAVERIRRHEDALAAKGIALPPPVYAAGTRVVQLGEDNFRTSRVAWESLPETIEGLRGVHQAVQAENREDIVVRVRDLRMDDTGELSFGEGPVGIEANGLRALVSRNSEVFPRAGEYLSVIDPDLRAANFNRQIARVASDKELKLRTRLGRDGRRQVFAVTSTRYASFDADEIAVVLSSALLDSGMRGEVVYDPTTTNLRIDGLYHADEVVDLAAGDVFKLGVQFRSNDAGSGSIRGRAIAWRNLCLNLIIIGTGELELLRRKHIGAVADVLEDVTEAAAQAGTLFRDFAEEWGALRQSSALEALEVDSMESAIEKLVEMPELDVGIRRDALVECLLSGWEREPGDSLADLVNAVTAVHLLDDIDQWRRERFEEAAGALVPILAHRAVA